MSKITMQQLADAAGVSRITVWKVLNDRPGVSEALRRTVRQKAQELGFELPQAAVSEAEGVRTFAIAVARPESSIFWMNIIHHIAKGAGEIGHQHDVHLHANGLAQGLHAAHGADAGDGGRIHRLKCI